MMNTNCDIAIIGGGPVGVSLALALREGGLDVRVLEAKKAEGAAPDPRALALSYGSRLLLERLRVWNKIPQVCGIRTIHISQKNCLCACSSVNSKTSPIVGTIGLEHLLSKPKFNS